jgi:hypothetical protein
LEETVLKTSVDRKPGESDLPDSQKWHDQMMLGDCQEIMREMPSGFVDLIITSALNQGFTGQTVIKGTECWIISRLPAICFVNGECAMKLSL